MRSRLHREHPLMVRAVGMKPIGTSHTVLSRDGTRIGYLSVGGGPSVLVVPGVLSMAADYAAFARALRRPWSSGIDC